MNTITITEQQRNYLERLSFEVNAYKDLLVTAMRLGIQDTDGYKKESEHYAEAYAAYETAKREVVENATGVSMSKLNWNIDFSTRCLTYEVVEQ